MILLENVVSTLLNTIVMQISVHYLPLIINWFQLSPLCRFWKFGSYVLFPPSHKDKLILNYDTRKSFDGGKIHAI
jgi:hypothetical protein